MNLSRSVNLNENVVYREKLFPDLGFAAFILFMTASLGIAFGKPYGANIGWLTFTISSSIFLAGAILQSPQIRITARQIQVGLATIDISHIGRVENLNPVKLADARKSSSSKIAYFVLRPGIKSSVVLEIVDTKDPHPFWHFSTRRPEQIVRVLNELKAI